MTRIVLVRHGQTAWNVTERFRGREDLPLDDTGRSQAARTADRIARQWKPSAVFSSPLTRAVITAEAIGQRCHLPVQIRRGLIDIDYGRWQGLTPEEAASRYPRRSRDWYRGGRSPRPPGGESLRQVKRRCMRMIVEIISQYPDQTVVLVGHTVVNRIILLGVLSLGLKHFWHVRQEPCAMNLIETDGREFVLCFMNDTCHLQEHIRWPE
jgi:broad specificity phosphatase PhoE